MATSQVDEVVSLSLSANELYVNSHFERSAKKWRTALAAVEALGEEDCVLVARFTTELSQSLLLSECEQDVPFSQAFVLELLDLHAASAATLRRRRDAGTLMEGKCRPYEVEWFHKLLVCSPHEERIPGAVMRACAKLVGYDAFLALCRCCLTLLCMVVIEDPFEHGGDTEWAFFSFVCDLCDEAVALMVQPRVHNLGTIPEVNVSAKLPVVLDELAGAPRHRAWLERLSQAQARLRQSGVIEKRDLEGDEVARLRARSREQRDRADRERDAAAASGQLKSCALACCGAKEAHVSHFSRCSACKIVVYCCREHQVAHWPTHKAACKAARKAAATPKDS
jgi:hypothetical protein